MLRRPFHTLARPLVAALLAGSAIPLAAQEIIPPKSYVTTPGGINVADQTLVHSVTDLSIGTLTLERTHRTGQKQPNDPMFGYNFASNFEIYVSRVVATNGDDKLVVHLGGSASGTYSLYGTSSINPHNRDAEKGRLAIVGGKYVYTDQSGTIFTFSATITMPGTLWSAYSRKIERIDFPNGMVRTFSYDGSDRLKLVEDTTGYAMVFDYNGNDDVTAACAFNRAETYVSASSTCTGATLKTSYGYTTVSSREYLTSATDVLSQVTSYTNGFSGVTCIKPPGYSICKMAITGGSYGDNIPPISQFTGITQTLYNGVGYEVWQISGEDSSQTPKGVDDASPPEDGHNQVTVTDPDGITTTLTFTNSSPYSMTDANGKPTAFRFDGGKMNSDMGPADYHGSMLQEATYPDENKYLAEYLGPFRSISKETYVAKPGSGQPNLVKEYGYLSGSDPNKTDQNWAKPIWIEDPNGNRTDYKYAAHGGVTSEMGPQAALGSPGSTVNARPLKLTTWTQRTARVKNSGGTLVLAPSSVWVIASETSCQTSPGSSTATCDGSKPQTVTTYEYGATTGSEALLVKGLAVASGGTTLRTCSSYDTRHQKVSETAPNANLGSCP